MKTSKKLSFPKLENEYLENRLRQVVKENTIIQMFFTKHPVSVFSNLIIHIEKNSEAQQGQQQKWVKKAREHYQIEVYFIYTAKLYHQYSLGHPFVEGYCQPAALIYQNKESGNPLIIKRNRKKFKKKFTLFQDRFYHEHELHKTHIQTLITEEASNSVFTAYARLIEYDLDYLEELYSGDKSTSGSLAERINKLIPHIPEIQKYFVKKSPNNYYLTELLVKAKEAITEEEKIYKNEMYEAIGSAEQKLYHLIEKRFEELKTLIKKGRTEEQEVLGKSNNEPKEETLDLAVQTILKAVEVEQIYVFHQITYAEKTTYYLMLIANSLGNEKLKGITQSLKSKMGEKQDFILLSHSRSWIQNNLYQYQSFFANTIQQQYLIYTSSPYHPELHWEQPHNPYHADLYFYYKPTKDVALQFFTIANNPTENYQGIDTIFSLFFLSFCRTYIFVKTYYLPNNLSSQTLWELCNYAAPDIRKHNHLIEHFWTDFFPYVDKHRIPHHKLAKLNKEKVNQMSLIVEKLMKELQDLVSEGNLLLNFEEE